jgi:hypothetical protein
MFPSECVLERRVRSDGDEDLAGTNLPLFILKCEHRKADGYADHELELYNERLQGMFIGVRLADAPPAVSYLAVLGAQLFAEIETVDRNVIVITLGFVGDGGRTSYLIYDAVALSLRLVSQPQNPNWNYIISSRASIAHSCQGGDGDAYALVLTGWDEAVFLYLWRPSSSSPPWSEKKEPSFQDWRDDIDTSFSFNGDAYWVDLLWGVSYYSCDALLDDDTSGLVEFGFIPLPLEPDGDYRDSKRVAQPEAYRAMGVVCDSFIRFVSIDGFQQHVKLKNRTITVWKLCDDQDEPWELEHEFSLKTLWGFQGFGDVPKDLTPMYPLLSTKDTDVIYLVLGECRENPFDFKFIPSNALYLLAVDMPKKIVTSVPLTRYMCPDPFVSFGFSQYISKALIGPCNDEGIPMVKDEPTMRHGGNNVAEAPSPQSAIPAKKSKRRRKRM